MPTFVFTYRSPTGYKPSPESMAAWMAWFDSIGDQIVDTGKPAVERTSVGNCSPDSTQLGGYSLISAENLDAAAVIAKACPVVDRRGGVEIGLLGEVPDPGPAGRAG